MLVLPDASQENAGIRAEEVRTAVSSLRLTHEGRTLDGITLSLGVASFPMHGQDWEQVVAAADRALYRAKQAGRDQVILHDPPQPDPEMTSIS